jgi:hypothetical protein
MSRERIGAFCAMSTLASRMTDIRHRDPVACADLRTSMNDWRVALSLANGASPEEISRDGYRMPPQVRPEELEAAA